MRYHVTVGKHTIEVEVERGPDGAYRVRPKDGPELHVTAQTHTVGLLDLRINGQSVQVLPSEGEVRFGSEHYAVRTESWLERAALGSGASNGAQSLKIVASMPGRIIQISCQVGDAVTVGAPLVVMEAMKMQNELSAKSQGIVRAIPVVVGQNVERGELLIELE
jgi:glutaconyl-CoA/methylmalonyl-CoA decarboxylase subunit gamma